MNETEQRRDLTIPTSWLSVLKLGVVIGCGIASLLAFFVGDGERALLWLILARLWTMEGGL